MGWFGTAFVGAVIGLFGWKFHRARDRFRLWLAVVLGATGATIAKLAGNLNPSNGWPRCWSRSVP